ncbi:MAG: hypothetical protein HFG26_12995 [Provencibacterium sp.]|nr:hypothetical protein [Provencibacterium sp.]
MNYHISQAGTLDYTPIFSVENTNRKVTIRIVGGKIYLDWEIYRQIEPTLQKLSVFLPPRLRAFAASWNQLRIWRGQRFPWPPGPAPGFSGDKTG